MTIKMNNDMEEGVISFRENEDVVYTVDQRAVTNSLLVARKFGKKHKHVLESIRKTIKTAENPAVGNMFVLSSYVNEQNHYMPMYVMNRDGFALLAMGFTGKEALKFKYDFISAFNKMEDVIKNENSTALSQPQSGAELLLMYAKQMVEHEKKLKAIEDQQQRIEEKVSEIAVRTKTEIQYSTIVGFASRFGIKVPLEKASTLGRVASNLCHQYLLETGRIPDPRFGSVKTYPDSVLYETFEKYYPTIRFR